MTKVAILSKIFFRTSFAAGIIAGVWYCTKGTGKQAALPENKIEVVATAEKPVEIKKEDVLVKGQILPRQGFFQALMAMGLNQAKSLELINLLKDNVELDNIVAGEELELKLSADSSRVLSFLYHPNSIVFHRLTRNEGDSLVYAYEELPTETKYRIVEGEIKAGSSLNDMLLEKGLPQSLTQVVNGVLLCKISFRTDAREGDRFKVLLSERFFGEERIDGLVQYASYDGSKVGFFHAYRYEDPDPKSSYNAHYTPQGEALIHSGLRYPIDRLHISSSYGMRIHPVTGRKAMHAGVDYSARTGTPVYAVAKGKVVESTYDQYSGNKVAIRHNDNSISYYLHLSKRSVSRGQTVRSRQMIGKVGATGRVTGPHLHFGFKNHKGRWINPLTKRMIATPKLSGDRLTRLQEQIQILDDAMNSMELMQALGFDLQGNPLPGQEREKVSTVNGETKISG